MFPGRQRTMLSGGYIGMGWANDMYEVIGVRCIVYDPLK